MAAIDKVHHVVTQKVHMYMVLKVHSGVQKATILHAIHLYKCPYFQVITTC